MAPRWRNGPIFYTIVSLICLSVLAYFALYTDSLLTSSNKTHGDTELGRKRASDARLIQEDCILPFEVGNDSIPCACEGKHYGPLGKDLNARRLKEAEEWKRHHQSETEPLSLCRALSPIQYIGSGITVEPLQSVRLIGLAVHPEVAIYFDATDSFLIQLQSEKGIGAIYLHRTVAAKHLYVKGNQTSLLRIRGKIETTVLDQILQNLFYSSTVYDINDRDIVKFRVNDFTVQIHIHIRRTTVPFLFDIGDGSDINRMVTVITKTFERYKSITSLIDSINKFYPRMTIIVADDSEHPRKINGSNVKQYIMPFAEGVSAGRNLALSQVRTKYFLWVDDDFVFTEGTKLERFIEKFENPNLKLDVIGGTFVSEDGESRGECFGCRTISWHKGDQDGDCFVRNSNTHYHQLKEYPQCYMADAITMFFIARTEAFRRGVFDPEYERAGHTEYFVNRLGKIRLASCSDVEILHRPLRNAKYMKYRFNNPANAMAYHNLLNMNLKCFIL
ncbi:beta-1,4 N-acetylgalactosaminyltransferase 1-like [Ptychodera flava]|uniref:beta-1,4 N-acetylgalactosaminyltransferase 1-like n=1 Tax=Ptychodera flava TaxID=63121 RepID=UPI003969CDD7